MNLMYNYRISVEDSTGRKHVYACLTPRELKYLINRFENTNDAYTIIQADFPFIMTPADFGWENERFQYWITIRKDM